MKFEEGSYVTDLDAIHKLNLNPAHVARLISQTFCEQIFRHGFVHCDPHDANLLVRENPLKKGRPQIVLLDHGLYKDMGDTLRKDYCRLWRALVTGDEPTIKEQCEKLYPSVLLLERPEHLRDGSIPMNNVLLNTCNTIDSNFYLQTHNHYILHNH
jgi:hypothetical protein